MYDWQSPFLLFTSFFRNIMPQIYVWNLFEFSSLLLNGDADDSPIKSRPQIKQGEMVYVKVLSEISYLTAKPSSCVVKSDDQSKSKQLITKG